MAGSSSSRTTRQSTSAQQTKVTQGKTKVQKKKAQTTKKSSTEAENNLKDSVRPGLILISIGLNPGITTGRLGHAYAHPSNRYWPTLHASGITPIRHQPADTISLMDRYGIGHTNIVPTKATASGAGLTQEDYMNGAKALDEKIRLLKPQAVMIVGKGIWQAWFQYKTGRKMGGKDVFEYGWQDPALNLGREEGGWEGARTFVVTTTSGLSSTYSTEERVAIWKPMGDWFAPKRQAWVDGRTGAGEEADSSV